RIQEVIKARQILLMQVVKEERGTKGAALTTYLSLAGRYCVLMPNTARGGGISRKISNGPDRKKLRTILNSLGIPKGVAVIVRTAGAKRTKAEIKRDYEYLTRLWNTVRDMTLESSAPCLVHEEGNLIKRTIRDLYNNDIEEIVVEGDASYRMAKDFMKLIIPSHAKRVQPYRDAAVPLFQRHKVESQLDSMHSPEVKLKSGGYIVINPTEALVAIDVNSGRSTRQRNIEETALTTNLEAAGEVARQLRLRDLAGLIVIDFIDMEVSRNNIKVERRLKEAMRNDRARIQLGRISPFGLLELSRQRLRPSIIETSSEDCPYCDGTGIRRSIESSALFVLRAIEEEVARKKPEGIAVHMPTDVALYILNHKRDSIADTESRNGVSIILASDDSLIPPQYRIELVKPHTAKERKIEDKDMGGEPSTEEQPRPEEEDGKRRRRRRGRKRKTGQGDALDYNNPATRTAQEDGAQANVETTDEKSDEIPAKRRRRGKRGGRRRGRRKPEQTTDTSGQVILLGGPEEPVQPGGPPDTIVVVDSGTAVSTVDAGDKDGTADGTKDEVPAPAKKKAAARKKPAAGKTRTPKRASSKSKDEAPAKKRTPRKKAHPEDLEDKPKSAKAEKDKDRPAGAGDEKPKPKRPRAAKKAATASKAEEDLTRATIIDIDAIEKTKDDGQPRKGWWRRD
ncbi:MAG: ribonuclease E/G, partial [Rhodospirillales bacterium]